VNVEDCRQVKRSHAAKIVAMLGEAAGHEQPGVFRKVVQVYRSDSAASEQATLLPKITIAPRYQANGFDQDVSLHYDYEFPLDVEWEIGRDESDFRLLRLFTQSPCG